MGCGSVDAVSLLEARRQAAECRALLHQRLDPIEARDARHAQEAVARARSISFADCARAYVAAHKAGWRNAKHADQWSNTLETYAGTVFGSLPVSDVDTPLVLKVLEPIWAEKSVTASRLRGRIEAVLDWARVRGYRQGENPARWRGHLDKLLPSLKKLGRVKHHSALPYEEIAGFMNELRALEGTAARALEFTILTAARTEEVIGSKPDEFDLAKAIWTVPPERMKAKKEHWVPLSARAVQMVRDQQEGDYIFPGQRKQKPLSSYDLLIRPRNRKTPR
jgi:integrase